MKELVEVGRISKAVYENGQVGPRYDGMLCIG